MFHPGLGVGFVVDEGQVAKARVLAADVLHRLQAARHDHPGIGVLVFVAAALDGLLMHRNEVQPNSLFAG